MLRIVPTLEVTSCLCTSKGIAYEPIEQEMTSQGLQKYSDIQLAYLHGTDPVWETDDQQTHQGTFITELK